jgi:hypothetical protein
MKIGFSLGRCIRDIVNGEVEVDSVAFIIAATAIRDVSQLDRVIEDYMLRDDYLYMLDEARCKEVALALWNSSKILQPRLQGLHRHKQPENSIWVDIFATVNSDSEAVKTAWNSYRFMLHMVENVDNDALEVLK